MEITTYKTITRVAPVITRVAAYARVSAEKDTAEHSFQAQMDYYEDYISKNPRWKLVKVYADDAISGTKENRSGFLELIEDCRAHKIDLIITKTVSRFARNTILLIETLNELKQLGVDVYFETNKMYASDPTVELALNLMALFAEQEARSVSENQIWRIKKKFERGEPTIGKMLGYRLKDGQLVIVPEEAEIVRHIFDLYLKGCGCNKISKILSSEGIKPAYSSRWNESVIRQILTNVTYKGDLLLQKTYRENFMTKVDIKNRGERNFYSVENAHEPIIPPDIFDEVQREKASRAKRYMDRPALPKDYCKGTHLFSGLIRCGTYGNAYAFKMVSHAPSPSIPVWICNTYNHYGRSACLSSKQIPESIMMEKTKEVLHYPHNLDRRILQERIREIVVLPDSRLLYRLTDGSEEIVSWQNRSRKESWTPQMKEAARQRTLKLQAERRQYDADDREENH